MPEHGAPGRDRRVRQHLGPLRRDHGCLSERADRGRDRRRPLAERRLRRALRWRALPLARRRARRSGRRCDRQPDGPRDPRGGDDRRPERRQARPQREAARRKLRRGSLTRRPGGRSRAPTLVLADHVHRRGAADHVAARRLGRRRPGARRIRRGQRQPHRELAPAARALLPHRAVRRHRGVSTDDPHGHVRSRAPRHGVRDDRSIPTRTTTDRRAVHARGSRLRRRSRRARERNDRPTHRELLRSAPADEQRHRAARRHRLDPSRGLAAVRRGGRDSHRMESRTRVFRWRTPFAASTGGVHSAT